MIVTETDPGDVDKLEYQQPAYVAVALIMAMSAFFVFFPMIITSGILGFDQNIYGASSSDEPCYDSCRSVQEPCCAGTSPKISVVVIPKEGLAGKERKGLKKCPMGQPKMS